MEGVFMLIPLSLAVVFMVIAVFVWSVKNGQYEDLDKEAQRILFDDDELDIDAKISTSTDTNPITQDNYKVSKRG
ncbi:MAG: cbb3-type cytochrome oxidase assembly protein CcoS [Pseudomonadales bacterium]|jgi:cbb3-type cytochrome oxidase maturation protein|nr:cbb3-type cytochrome oxidase assembly protein CcoS [Pseudomonadales bacterium]MDG1444254.1 cbb3-type cytochrome oxidase assembly protein CcoS [Pseudomonadales bacterium]